MSHLCPIQNVELDSQNGEAIVRIDIAVKLTKKQFLSILARATPNNYVMIDIDGDAEDNCVPTYE